MALAMRIDPRAGPFQSRELSVVLTFEVSQKTRSMNQLPSKGDGSARCITFPLQPGLVLND